MPPTLESIEASLASTETWTRGFALLAALFTVSAALAGVRLALLQSKARPMRAVAKLAAEERIATLQGQIAEANRAAAEANKAAALANEKAERERLARAEIEKALAPRSLSSLQVSHLADDLRRFQGQKVQVVLAPNDPEVVMLWNQLHTALGAETGAGLAMNVLVGQEGGRAIEGILVEFDQASSKVIESSAHALVEALRAQGLEVLGPLRSQFGALSVMATGGTRDPGAQLKVSIGRKSQVVAASP